MKLFSYCIPIRNRKADLVVALPTVLAAVCLETSVEVVVLDYGSTDGLCNYVWPLTEDWGGLRYIRHEAEYYHMAWARNLAMRAGLGRYLISTNADTLLAPSYFQVLKEVALRTDCDVMRAGKHINGVLAVKRDEFWRSGGFDERFEFYGPEDKDFVARLERRGLSMEYYDPHLLGKIPTPDNVKVEGYRLPLSKREMAKKMHAVYEENKTRGVLVANA